MANHRGGPATSDSPAGGDHHQITVIIDHGNVVGDDDALINYRDRLLIGTEQSKEQVVHHGRKHSVEV